MSKYSQTVLWIGIVLIVLNLVKSWPEIRSILFGTSSGSRKGDVIGNLPTTVKPKNGKCPAGYLRQSDGICRLHSKLPL